MKSRVGRAEAEVLADAVRAFRLRLAGDGAVGTLLAWRDHHPVVTGLFVCGITTGIVDSLGVRAGTDRFPVSNWSPDLPPPREHRRAVSLLPRLASLPTTDRELYQRHLRPLGVGDMARKLLYDGRRFVAVISVERSRDRARFVRDELREMDEIAAEWTPRLVAARAQDEAWQGETNALLFDVDGKCLHVAPGVRAWLDRERRAELTEFARFFEREGGEAARLFIGGTEARFARLESDAGDSRVLATLRPCVAPLLHPLAELSARQRQVAQAIAAGATAEQSAQELGLAISTIRRHLYAVYRVLGVKNRVELIRALSRGEAPSAL